MNLYIKKSYKDYVLYSLIIAGGIFLDWLTKFLAVKFLKPVGKIPIIEGVIQLRYLENTGAAFGMLKDHRWVFIVTSTVAIAALILFLYLGHSPSRLSAVALSMIVSGGIGNMIERIGKGFVVDFIDFCLIDFAVFNGADSFVCVGAGLMILAIILLPNDKNEVKK